MSVKNQGSKAAGSFVVRLVVDDLTNDADEKSLSGLDAGKSADVAFGDVKLKKKEHTLAATADAKSSVAESREDNNTLAVTVTCKDEAD